MYVIIHERRPYVDYEIPINCNNTCRKSISHLVSLKGTLKYIKIW